MSFQQLLSKSCDPSAKALFSCLQYQDCLRLSLCLCSFPGPSSAGLLETFTCLPSGRRLCRHLIVCYSGVGRMILSGPGWCPGNRRLWSWSIYSKISTLLLPYHMLLGAMFTFFEIQFPGVDNPS